MSIKKYIPKESQTIQAIKWDGKEETANKIREFLTESPFFDCEKNIDIQTVHSEHCKNIMLKIPLKLSRQRFETVNINYFICRRLEDKGFFTINEKAFQLNYKQIKQQDSEN